MKKLLLFALLFSAFGADAQSSFGFFGARTLTSIENSPIVIASKYEGGPSLSSRNEYLLFIDTEKGVSSRVDFTTTTRLQGVEHIKIEEHGIDLIMVSAKTLDINGRKGPGWKDPIQVFILSIDGKEKQELETGDLSVGSWVVNEASGKLVLKGRLDTNKNGKNDKGEGTEIQIFDLKSLELVSKF